jgi:hypothetical protein
MFFEDLLSKYKKSDEKTVIKKLMIALIDLDISKVTTIHNSSIVSKTTKMFEDE